MKVKTKRRRRVTILLVILLVVAGGVIGLAFFAHWRNQRQAQYERAQGIEAFKAGDYPAAVEHLQPYVRRGNADAQALYAYARARLKVPAQSNRHVALAMAAMIQAAKEAPNDMDIAHSLLDLRELVGQNDQALDLAQQLLDKNPDDFKALSARAVVFARTKHPKEALAAAQKAIAAKPDSYKMQLLALQLRHDQGESNDKLVAAAKSLLQQFPQDPHYEMIMGYTYALANDKAQAAHWLASAANRPIKDQQFAAAMVRVLDAVGMWDQSLALLTRSASSPTQATTNERNALFGELVRRLFEARRYQEVVERLSKATLGDSDDDADLEAIKAMALLQLHQQDKAQEVIDSLKAKTKSPAAPLWADVLNKVQHGKKQLPELIHACQTALKTLPNDAFLNAIQGNAYLAVGDTEEAIASFTKAAKLRPSWAAIRVRLAGELLDADRTNQAVDYARQALQRSPKNVRAAIVLAKALTAQGPSNRNLSTAALLDLIDQIQKAVPGEEQTLLLKASVLAQTGKTEQAGQTVKQLLKDQQLGQSTLIALTRLNDKFNLGLTAPISARIEKDLGNSPEVVMAKARQLAAQGQPQQGLALIDKAQKQNAKPGHEASWRYTRAVYLDLIHDPKAVQTWKALAHDYPDNAKLQEEILHASAVQGDREFADQIITRLENLLGADSVTARTERARWLLKSTDPGHDIPKAIDMLRHVCTEAPKRVEPRLLLAQGLEQFNKPAVAIRELQAANQAIPNSPSILLALAQLHAQARQFSTARGYLQQAAASANASAAQRRQAASLLARQGDTGAAIAVMEQLHQNGEASSTQDSLLLASLYARDGQSAKAQTMLDDLLKNPTPQVIVFALNYYGSQKNQAQVQHALDELKQLKISDAQRQTILANYYADAGELDKAAGLYQAILAKAPKDAQRWRQLVRFQLMRGNDKDALADARKGLANLPDDAGLKAIVDQEAAIHRYADKQSMRPLLASLLDAATRPTAIQALQYADGLTGADDAATAAAGLGDLATAHPDFLALQNLVALAYLRINEPDKAAQVASRAARSFPTAVEPAWLSAEALAAQSQWPDALAAALEWRKRLSGDSTRAADLMIAHCKLELGDADGAMAQIQPYVALAAAHPEQYPHVVDRLARIYLAQHQYDQAGQLLLPLATQGASWRGMAMSMAANDIQDPSVAADWLDRTAAAIPADALDERVDLGQSWWALAQRFHQASFVANASQVMDQVTAQPKASAQAWYMKGVLAEQQKQPNVAKSAYERAIKLDAHMAPALNNLAMVLVRQNGDLHEAQRLAQEAVRQSPRDPNFMDTLAHVQAKAKQYDQAVATMHKAIALDPDNTQWRRNLAGILKDCGRAQEAKKILDGLPTQTTGQL